MNVRKPIDYSALFAALDELRARLLKDSAVKAPEERRPGLRLICLHGGVKYRKQWKRFPFTVWIH